MNIESLQKLAEEGNLIIEKSKGNIYIRRLTIYKYKMPNIDKLFGKEWEEYEKNMAKYDEIKEVKDVKYTKYHYMARTKSMPEYQNWKITKKDYQILQGLLT